MAYVLLILGLIGAGIYTEEVLFYWLAGALGALAAIVWIIAALAAAKMASSVKKEFDSFDDKFGSLGIRNRRRF